MGSVTLEIEILTIQVHSDLRKSLKTLKFNVKGSQTMSDMFSVILEE